MALFVTGARIRCPNRADIESGAKTVVTADREEKGAIHILAVDEETNELSETEEKKTFKFDHVFGVNSSGGEVYAEMAKPLLETVLDGCNANFSVVGQSGAGKTYSLAGGILPPMAKDLFAAERLVSVDVTYLELHDEKMMDLLNPDATPDLTIREQPGYGVYVSGLTKLRVENEPELMKLVDDGEYPRQNPNSSTILTLWVRSHNPDGEGTGDVMGKFQFVEYCAYEPETQNQVALEAFGTVVSELSSLPDASRRNKLDFKESNLTWILKESLGGNCKSAFLGALSPTIHSYQQSLAVLRLLYFLIPCKGGPMRTLYPQYNFIKQVNNEMNVLKEILESELEAEDEDEMITAKWINEKAANGNEAAYEFIQKTQLLNELGASEAQKVSADKDKKAKRQRSMRKFKAPADGDEEKEKVVVADAPVIEETGADSDEEAEAPAAAAATETAAPAQEEQQPATEETQPAPVVQPVPVPGPQPDEETQPAAAAETQQAVAEVTPVKQTRPTSALTTMNEKDLADNSPRAKVHTYAASDHQFGLTSPTVVKNQNRKPKICLDHLGVDVPSEEQLQELFKMFDPNGDGTISLVEFRSVFKDTFENYGAPMEDRDVDRLFAKFDTGAGRRGQARDGTLSYQEFCILVLNRLRQ